MPEVDAFLEVNRALVAVHALHKLIHRPDDELLTSERCQILAAVDVIAVACGEIRAQLEDDVAASMETDTVEVPGWGSLVRSPRDPKVEWDKVNARRDAVDKIVQKVAADPMTGQVHLPLRRAIEAAMGLFDQAFSIGAPKVPFRTMLDLDMDEYRTVTSRGDKVTFVPVADQVPGKGRR